MSIYRRIRHEVPGLNTSSLPDLIFTVLFFFMIVTHMRKETVKVQYKVPAGTELTRLTRKSTVTHIYIGKPAATVSDRSDNDTRIQMNDKYVSMPEIIDYVSEERKRMMPEDARKMTVSIKADRNTHMGVITDVKQALRKANALKVNYSATSREGL